MKYLKMFALAAVAAGALMAFIGAGTASASTLCSTTADPCPTAQKWGAVTLKFSLAPGTSALLKETGKEGATLDTCTTSEVEGSITNTGSATATVTGSLTKLHWTGCSVPTTTTVLGKLEIHKIAGTSNGTLTADGVTKVTINTIFFGTCVYTVTSGASIGDLTEGMYTKTPEKPTDEVIFHANAVAHKQEGSNFACPETSVWSATYTLTSQEGTTLSVDAG